MISLLVSATAVSSAVDSRNIDAGSTIANMSAGYADQPMCIRRRPDNAWLCLTTFSDATEGSFGERVVASASTDRGVTWSPRVPLDPSAVGIVEYAYAAPWQSQLPSNRIFGLYVINSDNVTHLANGQPITRTDMLGHFKFRYSDDGGASWSSEAFEVPVRPTSIDTHNDFNGTTLMHWTVDHVSVVGSHVFVGFAKIGTYAVNPPTSVWFLHSPNAAAAGISPAEITWETWPDGDTGVRTWPNFSQPAISEEGHIVVVHNDSGRSSMNGVRGFYSVFRTTDGVLGASSSADGRTWQTSSPGAVHWNDPAFPVQTRPRVLRNPRGPITPRHFARAQGAVTNAGGAATRLGQYLLLYYNNGMDGFTGSRNPYWLVPGWLSESTGANGPIIEWGEPEVGLFNAHAAPLGGGSERGPGYPDFIEESDAVYITETQKTHARVHRIDPVLLAALFSQRYRNWTVPAAIDTQPGVAGRTAIVPMPSLNPLSPAPNSTVGGGFAIDLFVQGLRRAPGGTLLVDSRAREGAPGVSLSTGSGSRRSTANFSLVRAGASPVVDDSLNEPCHNGVFSAAGDAAVGCAELCANTASCAAFWSYSSEGSARHGRCCLKGSGWRDGGGWRNISGGGFYKMVGPTVPQSSGLTLRMTDDNGITVNASIAPTSQCAAWLRGDDESHYVGVSVDGAPGIVTFVVDGVLCDGIAVPPAQNEIRGWVTFGLLGNVTGSGPLRLGVSNNSVAGCSVLRARFFPRFLLTSEMIGNARAGAVSAVTDASLQYA